MVLYFFVLAFLVAALFEAIHLKLGSPTLNKLPDGSLFASNYSDMILSGLGRFICAKFNEFEAGRPLPIKSGELVTNQHRQALFRSYGEAYISALNSEDVRQLYNDTFRAEQVFLNPYKAAFICPACTLFWLAQIVVWPAMICAGLSWFQIGFTWIFFEPVVLIWHYLISKITPK